MTETLNRSKAAQSLKFGFATLAAAALVMGGVSPAIAASTQIGPGSIAGYENGVEGTTGYNYDQWHIGNTENSEFTSEDSLEFGTCSMTVLAPVEGSVTQVLKGFPVDGRPTTPEQIEALAGSISIDMTSGFTTLQLPVFIYAPESSEADFFTTFRNAEPFAEGGVHALTADTMLVGTGPFAAAGELSVAQLLEFVSAISADGAKVEVLGVGFTGAAGSVVNSLSFAGNTYQFGTGPCGTAPVKPKPPVSVQTGL